MHRPVRLIPVKLGSRARRGRLRSQFGPVAPPSAKTWVRRTGSRRATYFFRLNKPSEGCCSACLGDLRLCPRDPTKKSRRSRRAGRCRRWCCSGSAYFWSGEAVVGCVPEDAVCPKLFVFSAGREGGRLPRPFALSVSSRPGHECQMISKSRWPRPRCGSRRAMKVTPPGLSPLASYFRSPVFAL